MLTIEHTYVHKSNGIALSRAALLLLSLSLAFIHRFARFLKWFNTIVFIANFLVFLKYILYIQIYTIFKAIYSISVLALRVTFTSTCSFRDNVDAFYSIISGHCANRSFRFYLDL